MSQLIKLAPEFCLGGTIYPHDPGFDWSHDLDVLADAVRETHIAVRHHYWALKSPDRVWLQCPCLDIELHGESLIAGHFALVNLLTELQPDVATRASTSWRLPVNGIFLRAFHSFLVGLSSYHLLPLL